MPYIFRSKSKDPKESMRAIIVVEDTDVLEGVIGSYSIDAETGLFSGDLHVKNIPYDYLDMSVVDVLKKDLVFSSVRTALKFVDKVKEAIPFSESDNKITRAISTRRLEREEELRLLEKQIGKKVERVKPEDKQDKKEIVKVQTEKVEPKTVKVEAKAVEEPKKEVKAETKEVGTTKIFQLPWGFANVRLKNYENSYFLGYVFKGKEGDEVVLYSSPAIDPKNPDTSFYVFFADNNIAKQALHKLRKHPRHKKLVESAEIRPATHLDAQYREEMMVAIVRSPKKYLEWLEEVHETVAEEVTT